MTKTTSENTPTVTYGRIGARMVKCGFCSKDRDDKPHGIGLCVCDLGGHFNGSGCAFHNVDEGTCSTAARVVVSK